MEVLLLLSILVAMTSIAAEVCPDAETKKILEQNLDDDYIPSFVDGKTFSDVYARKEFINMVTSIETSYTAEDGGFKAHVEFKGGEGMEKQEELWKENEVKSTFTVTGEHKDKDGKVLMRFVDYAYFFFADENVIGYYACSTDKVHWRLVIAAEKGTLDEEEVKTSLKSAEDKMNMIRSKLPVPEADKEMGKFP